MKSDKIVLTVLLLGSLGLRGVFAQEALLSPREGEVLLGPLSFEQNVLGVPLSVRVSPFLAVRSQEEQFDIHARIVADLSDLQNKAGQLVDTIPLPTDNCAHFGVDNVVARIWGKQITIQGDTATLKLNGDAVSWTCAKNPVSCSKVEWEDRELGFGIKTRVPVVKFFDCNPPIKTINFTQPFDVSVPFRLKIVDIHTVAVDILMPSVSLGGSLAGVTNGILAIAGININERAKEALGQAINPDLLKSALPKELLQVNPVITQAGLFDNSGSLAVSLEMNSLADGKAVGDLVQALLKKPTD